MLLGGPPCQRNNSVWPIADYFTVKPGKKDINSEMHFYIIGDQYWVAAHNFLINERSLSLEDAKDARSFCVTLVWTTPNKFATLIYYWRVLNEDLAGNITQSNYLSQLETARKR